MNRGARIQHKPMQAEADRQLTLFHELPAHLQRVVEVYRRGEAVSNGDYYEAIAGSEHMPEEMMRRREPVGVAGSMHNLGTRRARWWLQDLKRAGWLQPAAGQRGHWKLTQHAKVKLTPQQRGTVLLGYNTDLGACLWGYSEDVMGSLDMPISLMLSSPVYPLAKPRAYGTVALEHYVDWLTGILEPVVKRLRPGGVIALNVSNDVFEPGSPARSTYRERLVIALVDRLGLSKMDEIIWNAPCKPPGPVAWASKQRFQLNVGWEPVYIFTNDPHRCVADNRRVLQEHTERHMRLMRAGGVQQPRSSSDGAYTVRPGSYGNLTQGRIPKNVLTYTHSQADPDLRRAKAWAQSRGLPVHGAPLPLGLARFLVEYLCPPDGLTVDNMSGFGTVGAAAEELGRPWIMCDMHREYVEGSSERFARARGFERHC